MLLYSNCSCSFIFYIKEDFLINCFQLIFSPTGGTERVANALTETWPNVQTIDLSAQNFTAPAIPFSADDLVVIAMPAFEAMAPQPALDRLAVLQGNGVRCP